MSEPTSTATRYRRREGPSDEAMEYSSRPQGESLLNAYEQEGTWDASNREIGELMARAETVVGGLDKAGERLNGLRGLLEELQHLPGNSWQQRWVNAGHEDDPRAWRERPARQALVLYGMHTALHLDVIRPSFAWLKSNQFKTWKLVLALRDPEGYEALLSVSEYLGGSRLDLAEALVVLSHIACHTGKGPREIEGDDLLAYYAALRGRSRQFKMSGHHYAWDCLRVLGTLNHRADTMRLAQLRGQLTTAELVEESGIESEPMRALLTRYLQARKGALDYGSLRALSANLCRLFWRDIELHDPGADSLLLVEQVAQDWKARLAVKPDGSERKSRFTVMLQVRAMYLDIAQWAHLEPETWARWAAPSPVTEADVAGYGKQQKEDKSRSHQRTRERAPVVRSLLDATDRRLRLAEGWLQQAGEVDRGSAVVHEGREYVRIGTNRIVLRPADVAPTDQRQDVDLTTQEEDAFWAWATVHVLHQTGLRIEELLELDQFSIQRWRNPKTDEIIPLLHVYPSKGGSERLLVASPELVVALGRIVKRLRQPDGSLPLTSRYDTHEKTLQMPAPLLFQRRSGPRYKAVSYQYIYSLMDLATSWAGLTTATNQPLRFRPHDLRRIFATEAQTSGVPIHVIAALLGHETIETTSIYTATYDADVIAGHRNFIAKRRAQTRGAEQRPMTKDEWEEFTQHFVERKLGLGSCGRAWGTSCEHEHACVRCSLLRADPEELPRFYVIRDNLILRIDEARELGQLGEVEGLEVTLLSAQEKIEALEAAAREANAPTFLGLPPLRVPQPANLFDALGESTRG
jgi:hypothetical protein